MKVYTEQELVDAVKRGKNYIEIEGSLATGVLAIRASGAKAWLMVSVLLIAALALSYAMRKPVVTLLLISQLGLGAGLVAIKLSYLAGNIGILNRLRSYRSVKQGKSFLSLKSRSGMK
ncbi:hypothetical protein DZA51_01870 [Vibrio campbellii]|nr:hypothetical protein DZA51_01870 [Vibrio campbellii]